MRFLALRVVQILGVSPAPPQQLLDYLKPEVSVIAVGNGNTYGHPNPETISRLVTLNSFIYQTESGAAVPPIGKGEIANGNFTIITDGDSYTISGASLNSRTRLTDSKLALVKEIESYLRFWPFLYFPRPGVEAAGCESNRFGTNIVMENHNRDLKTAFVGLGTLVK